MKQLLDIWIAGAAGDGVQSTADILCRVAARCGLHAFVYNSYQSAIRGGFVYAQVRLSIGKAWLPGSHWDILLALNADAVARHRAWAKQDAVVLFNSDRAHLPGHLKGLGMPISELVPDSLMQNVVFLGSLMRLFDFPPDPLERLIRETFSHKSDKIRSGNIAAAKSGFEGAQGIAGRFALPKPDKSHMIMTGNQAFALGAAQGGVRFYAAYPMTPATGILHWMSEHAGKLGICVMQPEDEISVINMAIGASFAGARAMVATSGGGFALMTEAIGLAAMTETPLVAVNVQRAGPSTGVPTKTEQGDLWQVLGAGQGDFPKAVIAPVSVEDAFYMTQHALNLADRHQIPVILISDLLLSEHTETLASLDPEKVTIDRGLWADPNVKEFRRYFDTPSGVSPRAKPGMPEPFVFTASSDEHDEKGLLISDVATNPIIRQRMMRKRMGKMEAVAREMPPDEVIGEPRAELTLVGWGSIYGVMNALVERGRREGCSINALAIRSVWPMNQENVRRFLSEAKKTVLIENSYSGQMGRLIRQETGFDLTNQCLKFDGEPFYEESAWPVIERYYKGEIQGRQEILTPYGIVEDLDAH
ncbi:MAG: 2-oxoacid:acceptor oxidoreductase subunit alpha [Elusimicrobia bacterium]|nr:2-oxoacid:acceptor oxidoreductase subunit alpha [Elusimicrobiota bacterium]